MQIIRLGSSGVAGDRLAGLGTLNDNDDDEFFLLLVSRFACSSALKVEVVCSSKMSESLRITWRYNPEDQSLQMLQLVSVRKEQFKLQVSRKRILGKYNIIGLRMREVRWRKALE
jgi:hypothetical protein